MDRSKKSSYIQFFLVAGCFSVGFFELDCFFKNELPIAPFLDERKEYVLSIALLYMLLGLTALIYQQKTRLCSLIWVLSYVVSSRNIWNMNDKKTLIVITYVMGFLLLAVVILDIANIKNFVFVIVSRIIWFTAMITQFSIMFYQLFFQEISATACLFYASWFYMTLFSMTQTVPFLELFSRSGMILGISSPFLMIIYAFIQSDPIIEEPITKLLYRLPSIVIAITMMTYVMWIRKSNSHKHRFGVLIGALAMMIGVDFCLAYITVYLKAYEKDVGVHKMNAQTAFIDQLNQDEYNWMEITGDEEMVSTAQLKYSIVDLNDGSMPVMFLSGGMSYAASGDTRIVFYDEVKQKPYQVWGNHNSVGVVGYIPSDKEHEYPLIFCKGGRQDLDYEFIYEVRNHNLYLIAEMYDIWPHEVYEIGSDFKHQDDEYYWLGEKVSMIQYQTNRDSICNGYMDITWSQ